MQSMSTRAVAGAAVAGSMAMALLVPTSAQASSGSASWTSGEAIWKVPANVSKISIEATGASGGGGTGGSHPSGGGAGAKIVLKNVPVTAGSSLRVWVGGRGYAADPGNTGGGSGGGPTVIDTGDTTVAKAILVAGGGGGGAASNTSVANGANGAYNNTAAGGGVAGAGQSQSVGSSGGGHDGIGGIAGNASYKGAAGNDGLSGHGGMGGGSAGKPDIDGGDSPAGGDGIGGYGVNGGASDSAGGGGGGGYGGGAGGGSNFDTIAVSGGAGGSGVFGIGKKATSITYSPANNTVAAGSDGHDGFVKITWTTDPVPPTLKAPGKPRAVTVSGTPTSAKRTISWKKPSKGGAVKHYLVKVKQKGMMMPLYTKTVKSNVKKVTISRAMLLSKSVRILRGDVRGPFHYVAYVYAKNSKGTSPAGKMAFTVKP